MPVPGRMMALRRDSVAFSGNFVPPAKSKLAKLEVPVAVIPLDAEVVVGDDVAVVPLAEMVVVPFDVAKVVVSVDNAVTAPAEATHKTVSPAPPKEPVSLIFMLCNPVIDLPRVLWGG